MYHRPSQQEIYRKARLDLDGDFMAYIYQNSAWAAYDTEKYVVNTNTFTTYPFTIKSPTTPINATIYGNMLQSGAPKPTIPIQPQECGGRTGNLFDEIYVSHTGSTIIYKPVYVGDGSCTLSSDIPQLQGAGQLFLLSGDVTSGASTGTNDVYNGLSRTVSSTDGYVTIGYRQYSVSAPDVANYNVMLNSGSTALPYEPYGIKIPISSANTTTPVYLGEVQTTRRIKKVVLTGDENWSGYSLSASGVGAILNISDMLNNGRNNGYCTHFAAQFSPNASTIDGITFGASNTTLYITFSTATATALNLTDAASIITWFSQQYTAGTPVTIWYILATPETAVVNESIRKINNYTDTVTTSIPVTINSDSVDINTTLKPSAVEAPSLSWGTGDDYKRSGGAWG